MRGIKKVTKGDPMDAGTLGIAILAVAILILLDLAAVGFGADSRWDSGEPDRR